MNPMTHREGMLTKKIENETSKVPSAVYLTAAMVALTTSFTLKCLHKNHSALFVGQWVSPLLIMGLYNKIVKTEGHD